MLVFSRKNQESVVVGRPGCLEQMLKITVLKVTGARVHLGFEVADDIPVHRWEVWQRLFVAAQNARIPKEGAAPGLNS